MANKEENLIVPELGESVTEATVGQWLKQPGDAIEEDETLVELETDKVTVEVNAPFTGVLKEIKAKEGTTVEIGNVLGLVQEGGEGKVQKAAPQETEKTPAQKEAEAPQPEPKPQPKPEKKPEPRPEAKPSEALSPAVRRMVDEESLNPEDIPATGKGGRITKEDVVNFLSQEESVPATAQSTQSTGNQTREERVQMSRLRQTIAKRLKDSQNTAATLTTFNEVDMSNIMDLRARMKDSFEKKYGVKLGFMSFFAKAVVEALKDVPAVNAEIDGQDLIYKYHYDIGIAVGAPQGLVVPVVRDADQKSFAEIESDILAYSEKARSGNLSMQDMVGGTFTITNGGIYGSLMATPILNPPQSGILGMHKIEKRPVVVNDQIVIRPMMYIALSYDHRVIDGKEAVTFLVRVKECLEAPERMLLNA